MDKFIVIHLRVIQGLIKLTGSFIKHNNYEINTKVDTNKINRNVISNTEDDNDVTEDKDDVIEDEDCVTDENNEFNKNSTDSLINGSCEFIEHTNFNQNEENYQYDEPNEKEK